MTVYCRYIITIVILSRQCRSFLSSLSTISLSILHNYFGYYSVNNCHFDAKTLSSVCAIRSYSSGSLMSTSSSDATIFLNMFSNANWSVSVAAIVFFISCISFCASASSSMFSSSPSLLIVQFHAKQNFAFCLFGSLHIGQYLGLELYL